MRYPPFPAGALALARPFFASGHRSPHDNSGSDDTPRWLPQELRTSPAFQEEARQGGHLRVSILSSRAQAARSCINLQGPMFRRESLSQTRACGWKRGYDNGRSRCLPQIIGRTWPHRAGAPPRCTSKPCPGCCCTPYATACVHLLLLQRRECSHGNSQTPTGSAIQVPLHGNVNAAP